MVHTAVWSGGGRTSQWHRHSSCSRCPVMFPLREIINLFMAAPFITTLYMSAARVYMNLPKLYFWKLLHSNLKVYFFHNYRRYVLNLWITKAPKSSVWTTTLRAAVEVRSEWHSLTFDLFSLAFLRWEMLTNISGVSDTFFFYLTNVCCALDCSSTSAKSNLQRCDLTSARC